jgi:hypothetical protein
VIAGGAGLFLLSSAFQAAFGGNGNGNQKGYKPNGNNGVGNGQDPQPPGNPPVNDGPGTSPGNPGNKGGAKK